MATAVEDASTLIRSGWKPPQWWFDFTRKRALKFFGSQQEFTTSQEAGIMPDDKQAPPAPDKDIPMAAADNDLQRLAEDDGAMFIRTAAGTWQAHDKDGIVVARDAMSVAEAARLYCEDQELVPSAPSAVLARIVKEYAPYDAMPEFRVGFESHVRGFYGNPYNADSVAAQAWDRGLEAASRYARAASIDRRELDTAGARLSAETGTPHTPPAGGEMVAGVYQESVALTSGRAAVIETGVGFTLVPWSSDLERQRGRHVSGVARDDGGVAWSFERKKVLEI